MYCQIHMYADDIQMYHSFLFENMNSGSNILNSDLKNIAKIPWQNSLKLNLKSSALLFGC